MGDNCNLSRPKMRFIIEFLSQNPNFSIPKPLFAVVLCKWFNYIHVNQIFPKQCSFIAQPELFYVKIITQGVSIHACKLTEEEPAATESMTIEHSKRQNVLFLSQNFCFKHSYCLHLPVR